MRGIVLLPLLLGSPLAAQGVALRMAPSQGAVTRSVMSAETFIRGGPFSAMMADTAAPATRTTVWQTTRVAAATTDEFTLHQTIDSARIEFPGLPGMGELMGPVGDMMRGTRTVSRVSSRGQVLDMDVTLSPEMEEMMRNAGGAAPVASQQANLPSFWLLPMDPIPVGESWRDSMTVVLDPDGQQVTYAATFTLRRMEGRVAVIGLDGTMATVDPANALRMDFTVTGEVMLNLAAGQATEMTLVMQGTTPTPAGDVPMIVNVKLRSR